MALVSLRDLTVGFHGPPLLDAVTCQIESGERVGLVGRNGAGKTTLLRTLAGEVEPQGGEVRLTPGTRLAYLPQEVPFETQGQVFEIIAAGLDRPEGEAAEDSATWKTREQVDRITSQMELDTEADFGNLSSGMKRRVLLARSLACEPDLLLLDEPTNHLDIDAIAWLEGFLGRWKGTLMFVTHDRRFLRGMARRIIEIERGRLLDWTCTYAKFLERKEETFLAEEKDAALFEKRLAEEERWIRQGVKHRRVRNQGRVRRLQEMRAANQERRTTQGKVRLKIQEGQRSGNLVAKIEGISFAWKDRSIVQDFSTLILRGDKIGIIGANGVGKTTLVRLLLGQLQPDAGTVTLGTNLEIAYFDQLREQLDEDRSVQDNISEGEDRVTIEGVTQHIIGYLKNFLFTPERARTPVRLLSGGERNRVLLARLFVNPANVIVLDEPTNDLDAETLELLEARLVEFAGTILVVSHDREFLNNVVTSTIAFEPAGVCEYAGGYDDWLAQRPDPALSKNKKAPAKSRAADNKPKPAATKLTYRETRELAELPARIEHMEGEVAKLHEAMVRPDYYQKSGETIAANQARATELEQELESAYERWAELGDRE